MDSVEVQCEVAIPGAGWRRGNRIFPGQKVSPIRPWPGPLETSAICSGCEADVLIKSAFRRPRRDWSLAGRAQDRRSRCACPARRSTGRQRCCLAARDRHAARSTLGQLGRALDPAHRRRARCPGSRWARSRPPAAARPAAAPGSSAPNTLAATALRFGSRSVSNSMTSVAEIGLRRALRAKPQRAALIDPHHEPTPPHTSTLSRSAPSTSRLPSQASVAK